ncbi:MAG: hypothetical protein JKX85_10370 [Phycisphaeraceae bacterium]|nr:hypothetical protein [Phycisphaeraceae bacterium]
MGDNPTSSGINNDVLARAFQGRITVTIESSLSTPQKAGSLIFDSRLGAFYVSSGAAWVPITGAASVETLAATLVSGNTTGGTDVEVTGGDVVRGEDAAAGLALTLRGGDGSGGVGGPASLAGGIGTTANGDVVVATPAAAAAVASGDVTVSGGDHSGSVIAGIVFVSGGDNSGTGAGGDVVVSSGDAADAGASSGLISVTVGDNTGGGPVADLILAAGNSPGGGTGGDIVVLTGASSGVPGSVLLGDPAGQSSHLVSRQAAPPAIGGAAISAASTDNCGTIIGIPPGGSIAAIIFSTPFPAGSEVYATLTLVGAPTTPGLYPHLLTSPTATGFSVVNPDTGPVTVVYMVSGAV